ncbi:MAG: flippase-like domain-containing protein [Bacteroidetes bacterium]|nr:flippase-like domain-containing protein [Bacteroidota bacterium]
MLQNKTLKTVFKTAVGLVLFVWVSYALYHQIRQQPNLQQSINSLLLNWSKEGYTLFTAIFLLMIANYSIEAKKWQLLVQSTERIPFFRSLQSVLTGIAISLLTPNRVGEYVGRILYLKNVHKWQGIGVTMMGSFAQFIVTAVFGLAGLIYYILNIQSTTMLKVFMAVSMIGCSFLIYLYFHIHQFIHWIGHFAFLKKIIKYLQAVRQFDKRLLVKVLFMSALRYSIYATQFFLLLKLCFVQAHPMDLYFSIALIFWAMAILPTIAIAEIGIRGEAALFFLLPLSTNQLGIVSATILLWFINLIIPALLGCLFMYKIKIYDEE